MIFRVAKEVSWRVLACTDQRLDCALRPACEERARCTLLLHLNIGFRPESQGPNSKQGCRYSGPERRFASHCSVAAQARHFLLWASNGSRRYARRDAVFGSSLCGDPAVMVSHGSKMLFTEGIREPIPRPGRVLEGPTFGKSHVLLGGIAA